MAVNGADSARVNRVLTTTLDSYVNKVVVNDLKRNDAIVGLFGADGRIRVQNGGERAVYTIDNVENPNFGFRSRDTDIPTTQNDSRVQAKYAFALVDGMVVINDIEAAMNAGDQKIYDLVEAELVNGKNTIIRKIADGLRKASPTNVDPESVISLIPDTAQASQTTTTGELSRGTTPLWKSQYSNAAMVLSTTAGLQALYGFIINSVAKGTNKDERPNFGLCDGLLYAALAAGNGDALRRFTPSDKMLKLGFDSINVYGVDIIADPSSVVGDLRLINTKYCELVALKTPGMQQVGERPDSLPISVREFEKQYNGLKRGSVMYLSFALTCSSLQRQGIATNCS